MSSRAKSLRDWTAPLYALILSAVITAPLAAPGYLLFRDAVSTPRSYLTDAALGVSEAAPRAVPQDFGIALVSAIVDGGVAVKALLAIGLWLAGWGAARLASLLVPAGGLPGQLLAATIAIWNPYVAERLLQGHWSLLVGYGCLPWIVATVVRIRQSAELLNFGTLAFWIGLAAITPTGAVLAVIIGLCALPVHGKGWRRSTTALAVLGCGLLAALPWLVVSAGGTAIPAGDSTGVHAFSARAEPGLGVVGSLASLGGIWNMLAVPASRTSLFATAFSAVLLVVVATGFVVLWRRRTALGLTAIALAVVAVPALMATGPGLAAVSWVITEFPGLGIVRDGQKWVALAMPGYATAGAATLTLLNGRAHRIVAAGVAILALVATLPDLAWGVGGRIVPVAYPRGWAIVAADINADPHTVALLPADTLRSYPWGPGGSRTPVLEPFPRWVRANTVSSGDLWVDGHRVHGDGTRGRRVEQLLQTGSSGQRLAAEGIGWVVVQFKTRGYLGLSAKTLAQLQPVYIDADIALYRVPGPWASIGASPGWRAIAIAAHLPWLLLLAAGPLAALLSWRRRRVANTHRATDWSPETPTTP